MAGQSISSPFLLPVRCSRTALPKRALALDWLLVPGQPPNTFPWPGREKTPPPGILPPQTPQGDTSPVPNSDLDLFTVFTNPGLQPACSGSATYTELSGTGCWERRVQQLLHITSYHKWFWSMRNFHRNIIQDTGGKCVCFSPPPLPHIFWSCFTPEAVRKNTVHFQFLTSGKSSSIAVIIRGLEGSPAWKTKLLGARPTDTVP